MIVLSMMLLLQRFMLMIKNIVDDTRYLERVVFTDEAMFHVNGVVNRHDYRIIEQPNEVFEYVRDWILRK